MKRRITEALILARKAAHHLWRLVTGRAALHVIDTHGATRFTLDARRSR